jgi:hypothetical protein
MMTGLCIFPMFEDSWLICGHPRPCPVHGTIVHVDELFNGIKNGKSKKNTPVSSERAQEKTGSIRRR